MGNGATNGASMARETPNGLSNGPSLRKDSIPISEPSRMVNRSVLSGTTAGGMSPAPNRFLQEWPWLEHSAHRVHLNDPSLVELDLSNRALPRNDFSILQKLLKGLLGNTCLKILRLNACCLQSLDVSAIPEVLRHNTALEELDISNNDLNLDSLLAVAEALKVNTSLLSLNCHGNVSNGSVETAFAEVLCKSNSTLLVLGLPTSSLDCRNQIEIALQSNRHKAALKLGLTEDEGQPVFKARGHPLEVMQAGLEDRPTMVTEPASAGLGGAAAPGTDAVAAAAGSVAATAAVVASRAVETSDEYCYMA